MTDLLVASAIGVSIRVTALAAGVALLLTLFRIRSSRTRHAAWTAVVVTMLLMPVLTRVVPAVHVSFPAPIASIAIDRTFATIDVPAPRAVAPATPREERATKTPAVAVPALAPADASPVAPDTPLRWSAVALAVYLAGIVFLFARYLVGLLQLSRIRSSSQRVRMNEDEAFESALVATPVTVGPLSPRVILPLAWREWSPEMLTAVLAHERAHATRRDPLVAALARLNCAVFWFHPLAWWLERKLAMLAEHACDDAAMTHVARRQYAETLLDIAATVRRHNGRLVWQGVGVDGDGRLGRRIDRVLSGTSWPEASRTRRVLVAASCAVTIAAAIACQQEARVEPLREDPELAAELKARSARSAEYRTAGQMTLTEAAALEKTLEQNPEDMATRERLLTFYRWTGKNTQSWNDNVAARRRHAIWLVEHHPESNLVMSAPVTKATDSAGYAQLRDRWLALSAPANVDPNVLSNAAWFFRQSDMRKAEELLLRGRAGVTGEDPQQRWAVRLGDLYVSALMPPQREARDPAASTWAKKRLDESNDAAVLFTAGQRVFYRGGLSADAVARDRQLGRAYIERASKMSAPTAQRARDWLRLLDSQRDPALDFSVFNAAPFSERRAIVEKSTGVLKLRQLTTLAGSDYLMAEYYDWRAKQPAGSKNASTNVEEDKRMASEGFAHAKEYARQALDLAPSVSGAGAGEATFSAHLASGLVALRAGDRKGAVHHLQEAATLPAPGGQAAGGWASDALEYRLVFYLLKHGERQTIIDYFERAAQGRDEARRKVMMASAAAIRDGRMPEHYQYLLASGSL